MKVTKKSRGFTLIELLVVIAIISLLSAVVLSALNSARAKARDARRLSDMHQMQVALDMYFNQFGRYPDPVSDVGCGGWDTTANGVFVPTLVANGFLSGTLSDPSINSICGNYFYYRHAAGNGGCDPSLGFFYVLGVKYMETDGTPSANPVPSSPGFGGPGCPASMWQSGYGLAWLTGKFEK